MRIEHAPATIAVVDDDLDSLFFAQAILSAAGHRVVTDSGAPGLGTRLASAPPNLILLDLHLDGRDGDSALREIRAEAQLRAVRVVGLTGALPGDPVLARVQRHLAGLIAKPIDPDLLTAAVHGLLASGPSGAGAEIEQIRRRFLDGLTDRLKRMEHALAGHDHDTLVLEVHRLRGAAGGFGYTDIATAAAKAELALRAGDAAAVDCFAVLIQAVRALNGFSRGSGDGNGDWGN